MAMKNSVAQIFDIRPKQWGLRGDSYLWKELQKLFTTISLPCSEMSFVRHFERFYQEITNHSLDNDESSFFVKGWYVEWAC